MEKQDDKRVQERLKKLEAFTASTLKYTSGIRLIATNDSSYNISDWANRKIQETSRDYSLEEVEQIVESGDIDKQIDLSRNYFRKDGLYKRVLLHYATILNYTGILIPSPAFGKNLSEDFIKKKYFKAMDFVDGVGLPQLFFEWALVALRDGCFYGVIQQVDNKSLSVLTLPAKYCASRFKDQYGNDVIEFNVEYFDSLRTKEQRRAAMKVYPKEVVNWYNRYKRGKVKTKWVYIDTSSSICLPFIDGHPSFLHVIPAVINYEAAVKTDRERDEEEIRKIIVQKIPHLQDGGLLFEPEEAAEIHKGTVNMMGGNKNVSVLTTYADVDAIISKTTSDSTTSILAAALKNVYDEAGASEQLFGSDSNLALESSLNNDMSLMMTFAKKMEKVITRIINENFSNSNVKFNYTILPITYYNASKYIDNTFKLASSGYSFLLPALASGLSQKTLGEVKDLEEDILQLYDKLKPLQTSWTQSGDVGRPSLDDDKKSDKTIANEKSLDKGGASNAE